MSIPAIHLSQLKQVPTKVELGLKASEKGDQQTARQMFKSAVKQIEGSPNRKEQLIELQVHIADTYFHEELWDQANAWYGRALYFSQRQHGENTIQAACLMTRLAEISILQSNIAAFHKHLDNMQRAYLLTIDTDSHFLVDMLLDLSWTLCMIGNAETSHKVNSFIQQIQEADEIDISNNTA